MDGPRYSDWEYERTPGCRAIAKGRDGVNEEVDEFAKPDGRESLACCEDSASCNN